MVALGAEDGGGRAAEPAEAEGLDAEGVDFVDDALADGGVADDAAGGVFAAGLELGLDEGEDLTAGGQAGG